MSSFSSTSLTREGGFRSKESAAVLSAAWLLCSAGILYYFDKELRRRAALARRSLAEVSAPFVKIQNDAVSTPAWVQARSLSQLARKLRVEGRQNKALVDECARHPFVAELDGYSFRRRRMVRGRSTITVRVGPALESLGRQLSASTDIGAESAFGSSKLSSKAEAPGTLEVRHHLKRITLLRRLYIDVADAMMERRARTFCLEVSRERLLLDSLEALEHHSLDCWTADRLMVKFQDEEGVDAGGLTREWFNSVSLALSRPLEGQAPLLVPGPDRALYPSPTPANALRLGHYFAVGRFLGLAIYHRVTVPLHLSASTLKFLLGDAIKSSDVAALDPVFFKNRMQSILKLNGVQEMCDVLGEEELLFLSCDTDIYGECEPTRLVHRSDLGGDKEGTAQAGGGPRVVTEANKIEYVELLSEHYLCGRTRAQLQCLLQGFHQVVPLRVLGRSPKAADAPTAADYQPSGFMSALFSGSTEAVEAEHVMRYQWRDLQLLLCGLPEIDVIAWERNSRLEDYPKEREDEVARIVGWFWSIMRDSDTEVHANILQFATGTSCVPVGGFAEMEPCPFTIAFDPTPEHLPSAHTCVNQIVLPLCESKDVLRDRLAVACSNAEGFGFA